MKERRDERETLGGRDGRREAAGTRKRADVLRRFPRPALARGRPWPAVSQHAEETGSRSWKGCLCMAERSWPEGGGLLASRGSPQRGHRPATALPEGADGSFPLDLGLLRGGRALSGHLCARPVRPRVGTHPGVLRLLNGPWQFGGRGNVCCERAPGGRGVDVGDGGGGLCFVSRSR